MKSAFIGLILGLGVKHVVAHATFQDLWINGVDYGSQCVRMPLSNSPVTDVTSDDIRCNVGTTPVPLKCAVKAGDTVTVEMHQQPGDRSCADEAIGGDHYGPISVWMSKVSDSSTADGSSSWFRIYEDSWAHNPSGSIGSDDFWGTKDMNTCCGLVDVKIPTDIEPGDYLLRAEVLALHVAMSPNGAQFYMSCYQLTVSGSGSSAPSGVLFPGAYGQSDPGILINIYQSLSTYVVPGPTLYSGGSTKSAGAACSACETTCTPGSGPSGTVGAGSTTSTATTAKTTTTSSTMKTSTTSSASTTSKSTTTTSKTTTTTTTSSKSSTTTIGNCSPLYGQCGGIGYTGATCCSSGTCQVSNSYYSQCL